MQMRYVPFQRSEEEGRKEKKTLKEKARQEKMKKNAVAREQKASGKQKRVFYSNVLFVCWRGGSEGKKDGEV